MINWKLRLMNKTTLTALVALVIGFVYEVFGILGVVPALGQGTVEQLCTLLITVLAGVGVVVDPTTAGISDSAQAMQYNKPKE